MCLRGATARFGRVAGLGLLVGLLVLGLGGSGEALLDYPVPTSPSDDPNQLSTASVLFVKVDPASGTDTLLVLNRQQVGFATTPGAAIELVLVFYDSSCLLRRTRHLVALTPQDVEANPESSFLFQSVPGVVLAYVESGSGAGGAVDPDNDKFLLSGVVIDGDFGAIYERKASPLLSVNGVGKRWGGFSDEPVDDWYIGGATMLQAICPQTFNLAGLADDMHRLETGVPNDGTAFATEFPTINVYVRNEVLKRSIHNVPCFCNTDSSFFGPGSRGAGSPGDFADVVVSFVSGFGTLHMDTPISGFLPDGTPVPGAFIGWRVHAGAGTALGGKKIGGFKDIYWDARLSRTPTP